MSYCPPYPYARILGGFILGNIILTALLYLLLRPGFLAGSMMPFAPRTLAVLCGAAVIANQLIFSYNIYANLSAFAQYSGKICMKD